MVATRRTHIRWSWLYGSAALASLAVIIDILFILAYFAYPGAGVWPVPLITTAVLVASAVVFLREWRLARPELERDSRVDD